MSILHDLLMVTAVALVLGAGLPALFAIGVRLDAAGAKRGEASSNTAGRVLAWITYAICLAVIIAGVLWITNATIAHYTGVDIFGTAGKSGH